MLRCTPIVLDCSAPLILGHLSSQRVLSVPCCVRHGLRSAEDCWCGLSWSQGVIRPRSTPAACGSVRPLQTARAARHCPLPTARCPLPAAHCPLPQSNSLQLPLATGAAAARSQPWGRRVQTVAESWECRDARVVEQIMEPVWAAYRSTPVALDAGDPLLPCGQFPIGTTAARAQLCAMACSCHMVKPSAWPLTVCSVVQRWRRPHRLSKRT